MKPLPRAVSGLALAWACAWGQAADASSFEVASVKLPPPDARRIECSGGPGTASPGIWRCSNVPLSFLIFRAYGFEAYQFAPNNSCCMARFDFNAKVPAGATQEQFRSMIRNLLETRFKLALHLERKEMPVYELTVDEKGLKMKEPAPAAAPPPEDPWEIPTYSVGNDGYPVFPPGRGGLAGATGRYRWKGFSVAMPEIVKTLSFHLGRPVVDATGLKGTYDIDLKWGVDLAWLEERAGLRNEIGERTEPGSPGPPLVRAVQDQLGLKLTSKKGHGEIVVIDHLEKMPTGN